MENDFDYIQNYYKVPAEYGRRVEFDGRKGIIVGTNGSHLEINFDDEKPMKTGNYHPTWKMKYLDMGAPRKMTRSQIRYKEYLHADTEQTFSEWLGIVN